VCKRGTKIIMSMRRYCNPSCLLLGSLVCLSVNVWSAAALAGRQAGDSGVAGTWWRLCPTSAYSSLYCSEVLIGCM